MKYTCALLARFGWFVPKPQGPDAFDLRLQRIGLRERRRQTTRVLFKAPSRPLAA